MEGHQGAPRQRAVAEEVVDEQEQEQEQEQKRELELGQAADGDHGVGEERERPDNGNICCICHEPLSSSGAHRICCIPCGHVYGRSCLETWMIRSGGRVAKCLWCRKVVRREDMINLYGTMEEPLPDHGRHEHEEVLVSFLSSPQAPKMN